MWLGAMRAFVCVFIGAATLNLAAQQQPQNPPPAQQSPPKPTRDPAVKPKCIYCPAPDYSAEAREKHIEGDVWLEVIVTADGKASDRILVTKSMGYGLNEQATKAVKKWKFRPGKDGSGKPVDCWTVIQVQFRLTS
jgi:protein TonB